MNPYERYQQQYQQQMVTTMTQSDMLLKLYDEMLHQMDVAREAIMGGNTALMDAALNKTKRIVQYLRSCVNLKYPVSDSLWNMYQQMEHLLVMTSVQKDSSLLADVQGAVQELRDAFDDCARSDRAVRGAASVADVV